ncbi:MAG: substrate-binding domain-containing protein [Rhodospirillales bacterium]|nr:substrate-binding domain-containing protein [Rhodospirillales bacterium]
MSNSKMNRRKFFKTSGTAAASAVAAATLPGFAPSSAMAAEGGEYVYLSIVTQVPFWVDHRLAMKDCEKLLGIKTTFTGPLDWDPAGQARQLDEIVVRRPKGIMIFPGDAEALVPGINSAVDAGIPVATIIGDVPGSKRSSTLGISSFEAGKVGGEMLAEAIGGAGKVILGTFPAPSVLARVEGYKALFKEKFPNIEVVDVVNDKADPSYAPTAYAQALQAHPDVVGIGGTDGDSGKGAAIAVREAGKIGKIKIVAMDRNDDMLEFIKDGTIYGSVAQKSYAEMFTAIHFLHWLNSGAMKVLPDWKAAGVNPLPENVVTGVMRIDQANVDQFVHS